MNMHRCQRLHKILQLYTELHHQSTDSPTLVHIEDVLFLSQDVEDIILYVHKCRSPNPHQKKYKTNSTVVARPQKRTNFHKTQYTRGSYGPSGHSGSKHSEQHQH